LGERAYSLYDVEQFIREAGAERVTEDAVLDLEHELEKLTEALAGRAQIYAAHAGRRKVIKKSDVFLASYGSNHRRPYTLRVRARTTNAPSTRQR
jgi:histone H3/H4